MTHTKVAYTDVEPVGEGMHFLRDALDCERLGVTVLDCEPGWTGKEHDHADDGQEEVYLLVEGEEVAMESGDALRVAPEATRRIRNGETESTFVLAGAE